MLYVGLRMEKDLLLKKLNNFLKIFYLYILGIPIILLLSDK